MYMIYNVLWFSLKIHANSTLILAEELSKENINSFFRRDIFSFLKWGVTIILWANTTSSTRRACLISNYKFST